MDNLSLPRRARTDGRKVRLLLARSYLREQRVADALDVYAGLLRDDPQDAEARAVLAALYRLVGAGEAADPLAANALARLAERLAAEPVEAVQQAVAAAVDAAEPARQVPVTGETQLLTVLADLQARQARAAGDPEQAEALRSLQIHLANQQDQSVS